MCGFYVYCTFYQVDLNRNDTHTDTPTNILTNTLTNSHTQRNTDILDI